METTSITECRNCQHYAAVVTGTDGINRLHDLASNGYDVTDVRHVCGESDRRHA